MEFKRREKKKKKFEKKIAKEKLYTKYKNLNCYYIMMGIYYFPL